MFVYKNLLSIYFIIITIHFFNHSDFTFNSSSSSLIGITTCFGPLISIGLTSLLVTLSPS
jgi:hypothetical protein